MGFVKLLCIAILITAIAGSAAVVQGNQPPGSVTEMQKRLGELRGQVEQLLDTQADIYDQLDKVESELELSSRLLRELRQQARSVASEIDATKDTIQILKQQSSAGSVLYAVRLRAWYKMPAPEEQFVPFASLPDASSDEDYLLRRMVASDRQHLTSISSSLTSNEKLLANLKTRQGELVKITESQRAEEAQSRQAVQERDRLLAQVRGQQRQKVRQLEEVDESSDLIGDIFDQIESQRRQTVAAIWQREHDLTLRLKGRFYRPVSGGTLGEFGVQHQGDGRLLSRNNGINLATRPGAKVIAAATGEVLYIGWARGLERFAVVDHGGSIYSLYGNLDQVSVAEGDQVIRGEQFATAAGAQLHFEIRDGKTPVDPVDWLRK